MLFADTATTLESYRITASGFLVADVRFARTGIQSYAGAEIDRSDLTLVDVYRPPAEVFSANAMRSFAGSPLTMGHPADAVSASTWRQHSIGRLGEEIIRDGDFVRATLIVQDAAAIDMIRGGTRELSAGYNCDVQWDAGKTADGHSYHAVQRLIRGNHVAVVDKARAGSACRIGMAA